MPHTMTAVIVLTILVPGQALAQQGVMVNPLDRPAHLSPSSLPDQKGKPTFGERLDGAGKTVTSVGMGVAGPVGVPGAAVLGNALESALGTGGSFGDAEGTSGASMMNKMQSQQMTPLVPTGGKQPAPARSFTPVVGPTGSRSTPTTR